MVFSVNKQWVLRNFYRKSMLNKYDHWYHEQSAASVTVIESLEFGKITSICGSCTAEVEFEFPT